MIIQMWISKKKCKDLEKRISDLEKEVQDLKNGLLVKICTNSVMKEQYNFELLKFLFEELNIEKPELEYKFFRRETSSKSNR